MTEQFQLVRTAGLTVLFLALFNRFSTMVFVLNFTTEGINATVLLTLFTLSAVALKVFMATGGRGMTIWQGVFFVSVLLAPLQNAVAAVTASSIALQAISPLVVTNFDLRKLEVRGGLVTGLAVNYLSYALLGQLYFFGVPLGVGLYYVVALTTAAVTFLDRDPEEASYPSFLLVYPVVMLMVLFTGAPSLVAMWNLDGVFSSWVTAPVFIYIMQLSSMLALLVAYILAEHKEVTWRVEYVEVAFLVFLVDLLWTKFIPPLSIFVVLVTMVLILFRCGGGDATRHYTSHLFITQFLCLIFLFLYVAAGNWVFLPSSTWVLTRGMAHVYIFLTGGLLVVNNEIVRRYSP